MYNMLFGVNQYAELLKKILDLDQPDDKWSTGRFRDIYLQDGKIILYTRNGGGNREDYFPKEIVNHPNYIRDYDDDFDSTYCYIEFSIPEEFMRDLINIEGETYTPTEKFKMLIESLNEGR